MTSTHLPAHVSALMAEWELEPDGEAMHGHTALVVPVRTVDDVAAVLKTLDAGPEERHEILGLQTWAGDGVVRLLRGDPRRGAMVLERAGAEDLRTVDDIVACEIVAGLYRRLHVPAPRRLDLLTDFVARWSDELGSAGARVPRRVVEQAVHLVRDLVSDPGSVGTLIHGDLHHENVLASRRDDRERDPWLVIDPKPMSGDPHYEVAPMLWSRWDEVVASGDIRWAVRRRFHTLVDVAGLDEDRARDWVIVRKAFNALWSTGDDDLTKHLTILKAVQD
ncbi:aminoglycoside phosphotransferase family protein [Aeromicrobium sp. CF3.5]|uniref:aminoglycoside phosphotransferase family protein n=1 Tax=Aeromicrobium sp. CF3.5 TaxID=3373078 RepID=UPI003EE4CD7A